MEQKREKNCDNVLLGRAAWPRMVKILPEVDVDNGSMKMSTQQPLN